MTTYVEIAQSWEKFRAQPEIHPPVTRAAFEAMSMAERIDLLQRMGAILNRELSEDVKRRLKECQQALNWGREQDERLRLLVCHKDTEGLMRMAREYIAADLVENTNQDDDTSVLAHKQWAQKCEAAFEALVQSLESEEGELSEG